MAFGEVFYQTWTDTEGIEHEVKLLQDGYAGSTNLIPYVSITFDDGPHPTVETD